MQRRLANVTVLVGAFALRAAVAGAEEPVISRANEAGPAAAANSAVESSKGGAVEPGASGGEPQVTPAAARAFTPPYPAAPPNAVRAPVASAASPAASPAPASVPPVGRAPAHGLAGYLPPAAYGPAPFPEAPSVVDARLTDAHVDRVILVPTAETHPAGTVYLSSYDIVGLQGGYALGDRSQLTLSFVPPLAREAIVPLDLTLKTVLLRGRRVRIAAMFSASGILGLEEGAAALGRVGGVTELCFDDACRSSISTAGDLVLAGSALVFADGVGAVLRASNLFAVLAELQSVLPVSRQGGQINALGGALGFRFSGRTWAVDLAVEGPIDRKSTPAILPVVIGTVRFL